MPPKIEENGVGRMENRPIINSREGHVMSRSCDVAYKFKVDLVGEPCEDSLFHLTAKYLGADVELEPVVPPDADYAFEDIPDGYSLEELMDEPFHQIHRPGSKASVSFSPTPEQCLLAIAQYKEMSSGKLHIYGADKNNAKTRKSQPVVQDLGDTDEYRAFQPVKAEYLGTIDFEEISKQEAQKHLPQEIRPSFRGELNKSLEVHDNEIISNIDEASLDIKDTDVAFEWISDVLTEYLQKNYERILKDSSGEESLFWKDQANIEHGETKECRSRTLSIDVVSKVHELSIPFGTEQEVADSETRVTFKIRLILEKPADKKSDHSLNVMVDVSVYIGEEEIGWHNEKLLDDFFEARDMKYKYMKFSFLE